MKPRLFNPRPVMLAVLLLMMSICPLFAVGCAMRPIPGETDEDFAARQQEARETTARAIQGVGETAAQLLPPPFGTIAAAALLALGGWYAGQRRRPTAPNAPSASPTA